MMAEQKVPARHILLTGVPGVGKTTLMTKIHQELSKQGVSCSGFITEEVRDRGKRIGFDVVTLDGNRGQLSRVGQASAVPGAGQRELRVGQYCVNLLSFEQTALITLRPLSSSTDGTKHVYLIDEIGKMELFSQSFIQAVRKLKSQSSTTLVATIPVPKGRPIPFVEELRGGENSQVFEVTHHNRDTILSDILKAVQSSLPS